MKAHHESACSQRDSWIFRFIFQDVALAHPASLTNFNVFPVATGPWRQSPNGVFPSPPMTWRRTAILNQNVRNCAQTGRAGSGAAFHRYGEPGPE